MASILHLADCEHRFALWAESSSAFAANETDFPFQSNREDLNTGLQAAGFERPEKLSERRVWIWAPGHEGHFFASDTPMPPGLSLAPRELGVLSPEPLEISRWLSRLTANTPGLGPEFAVWFQLLRLAASLLQRQRLLPGLIELDDPNPHTQRWLSSWEPLLEAEDHLQLAMLAKALPGSVRALSPIDSADAPRRHPQEILQSALSRLCDGLVRMHALGPEPGALPMSEQPLAERWLAALRQESGYVLGPEPELRRLARQLEQWSGALRRRSSAPFQLVFQLEEPTETSDSWYLRPLLRPFEDASLYLPLEYVWAAPEQQPEPLRRQGPAVREFVQSSLYEAAGHCLSLKPLAADRYSSGLELDLPGVKDFLAAAEHLEEAGFGMRLPSWWVRGRQRLKARARFSPAAFQSEGALNLGSLIDADWKLMLGDTQLSIEELREIANLKSDLVQWQGQWLLIEPDTLQAARRFFARSDGKMTLQDALALGPEGEAAPFELEALESEGWLQDFLSNLQGGTPPEIPVPKGFVGTLRDYQLRGLNWLVFLCGHGLGACLADDMGLGKTIQTLALMLHVRHLQGKNHLPMLLVCPTSLLSNWLWEAEHFTPDLKVHIHHGTSRAKTEAFAKIAAKHDVIVTSYSLLARDKEFLLKTTWAGVILDEAQNVKNPETQQARVARALNAGWRVALTGTPVENHVGDLWSLMDFLNPRLLGSRQAFQEMFLTPIQRWQDKDASARLRRLVAPFVMRRLKSDKNIVAELPEKLEMKVHCTLTREQVSLYLAVVRDLESALERSDGMTRRGMILASLTRLKQICNHPAQFLGERTRLGGRSGKLMRLKEMLEEILENGEKSLIFTQYAEMGQLLQRYLSETLNTGVLLLHGGTPATTRPDLIQSFQNDPEQKMFVLSLKAGGTGLNLTAASHVFHFDRWWNPAVENQATDRAYRIGQTRRVQVHAFVCSGTIEERIDQLLTQKRSIADQIVGSGEQWLTELSNDELHELFALDLSRVEH